MALCIKQAAVLQMQFWLLCVLPFLIHCVTECVTEARPLTGKIHLEDGVLVASFDPAESESTLQATLRARALNVTGVPATPHLCAPTAN